MPLDKKKLKDAIKKSLDKAYNDYVDGNEEALSPAVVADDVVDMMHSEIEEKLKKLIKINLKIIDAVRSGMSAITPPGNGAVGAAAFQSQVTQHIIELKKIQLDLQKYKG